MNSEHHGVVCGASPTVEDFVGRRLERELAACGLTPARGTDARHVEPDPQELAIARLLTAA